MQVSYKVHRQRLRFWILFICVNIWKIEGLERMDQFWDLVQAYYLFKNYCFKLLLYSFLVFLFYNFKDSLILYILPYYPICYFIYYYYCFLLNFIGSLIFGDIQF